MEIELTYLREVTKNILLLILWIYIGRHNNIYVTRVHVKKTQQQECFVVMISGKDVIQTHHYFLNINPCARPENKMSCLSLSHQN